MKFRNIKISLKITVLVACIAAVSATAISYVAHVANSTAQDQSKLYFYTGLAVCTFAILVAMIISGVLTQPLESVHFILRMVSKGELPEKSENQYNDEFGKIQHRVDDLVEMLKRNAQFAQKVGEGKFDTPFQPASENDSLVKALMDMRDNLLGNDRKEKEHNWIVLGLAEAGDILRTHDKLDALGDAIVRFIVSKVGAIQGAFYVLKD